MHENPDNAEREPTQPLNPGEATDTAPEEPSSRAPFPGTESHDSDFVADEASEDAPAAKRSLFPIAAARWLTWDVRFKLAVVVSFLLLVATLILNRNHLLGGKQTPKLALSGDSKKADPSTKDSKSKPDAAAAVTVEHPREPESKLPPPSDSPPASPVVTSRDEKASESAPKSPSLSSPHITAADEKALDKVEEMVASPPIATAATPPATGLGAAPQSPTLATKSPDSVPAPLEEPGKLDEPPPTPTPETRPEVAAPSVPKESLPAPRETPAPLPAETAPVAVPVASNPTPPLPAEPGRIPDLEAEKDPAPSAPIADSAPSQPPGGLEPGSPVVENAAPAPLASKPEPAPAELKPEPVAETKPALPPDPRPEDIAVAAPAAAPASVPDLRPTPREEVATGPLYPIPFAGDRKATKKDSTTSMAVDAPRPVRASAGSEPSAKSLEPVTHVVRRGENFFSIAKYYYGSGWCYKALWDANKDQASTPEDLYVGTTLRIPSPEDLRRDLIEAPPRRPASRPQTARKGDDSSRFRDQGTRRAGAVLLQVDPATESRRTPRSETDPNRSERTYEVQRDTETLRTIARDVLQNPERDGEIEDLNRAELEENGGELRKGMRLKLPPKTPIIAPR